MNITEVHKALYEIQQRDLAEYEAKNQKQNVTNHTQTKCKKLLTYKRSNYQKHRWSLAVSKTNKAHAFKELSFLLGL